MASLVNQVLACALVVLVAMAAVEAGAISKRRVPTLRDLLVDDDNSKPLSDREIEFFNKMVLRIMDTLIEDARERGVTNNALESMMRKRGGIRKCFFHAVNCW